MSIVTRIAVAACLSLVIFAGGMMLLVQTGMQNTIYNGRNARLKIAKNVLLDLIDAKGEPALDGRTLSFGRWRANGDNSLVEHVRRVTGTDATLIALIDDKPQRVETTIVDDSRNGTLAGELQEPVRVVSTGHDFVATSSIGGHDYLNHYMPLRDRGGRLIGVAYTSVPLAALHEAVWLSMRWMLLDTAFAFSVSLLLLYFAMKPLRLAFKRAVEMANGLAAGEVDQPTGVVTRDELGEVQLAFEAMIRYQQHMAEIADGIANGDFSVDVTPVSDRDRLGVAVASMSRKLATLMAQLERSAMTDSLTQLGNRRAFDQRMRSELSRIARHGGTLSLAIVDVDHFKAVNDASGHQQGDVILSKLAQLLSGLRAEDCAYRLGGDEFAVVLTDTTAAEAKIALERVRADAQRDLLGATVSVGIGSSLEGFVDGDGIRGQADAALYAGKQRGRNIVIIFDDAQCRRSVPQQMNVQAVMRLIDEAGVKIHFQPIWDLRRSAILGFEALARPDASYGLSGPQEAFDVAAKIGRAHELDRVCREAAIARSADMPDETLLFLNVSPETLARGALQPEDLTASLAAAGLAPGRVVLEITERFDGPPDAVIAAASVLQRAGFKLALDDTGAGNAGLEYMGRLRADYIKIDAALVANAGTDAAARGLVAAIVAFAAMTGAYVIAEGIEDQAMLDMLRPADSADRRTAHQIHGVQGYYLGRPAAAFATVAAFTVPALLERAPVGIAESLFIARG